MRKSTAPKKTLPKPQPPPSVAPAMRDVMLFTSEVMILVATLADEGNAHERKVCKAVLDAALKQMHDVKEKRNFKRQLDFINNLF